MSNTLFLLKILLIQLGTGSSLKCLSCSRVSSIQDCDVIRECPSHQICYSKQLVSQSGVIYREAGCRDRAVCSALIGKRAKRVSSGDVVVCDECCSTPFCQAGLCGDKAYRSDRGPICYNCVAERGQCDLIHECGRDEVCYEALTTSPSGDTLLKTSCMFKSTCNSLLSSGYDLQGSGSGHHGYHCFNCCPDDLCNNNCSLSSVTSSLVASSTVAPTGHDGCTDSTTASTCKLAAPVVCGDVTKARNAGCSHYCGFCCTDSTSASTCRLAASVVCGDVTKARNAGCSHYCGFC